MDRQKPEYAVAAVHVISEDGATALVEVVFSWPGLGQLLVSSVLARDLPMLQGGVFVIALVYVVTNIVEVTVRKPNPPVGGPCDRAEVNYRLAR